jgi:protein O-mannosyl-transferase
MNPNNSTNRWIALLLLAVTVLVYAPCLHGTFIWDDEAYISQNSALTSVQGLHDIWLKPGAVQQYYPVTFTAFWLEYHLWGLNPLGYHLVNVLLHGLNAILLWCILSNLGVSGAWIAAWLFALHPVMAESVAWMTELKNVLSTFFYLLTVMLLLKPRKNEQTSATDGLALALFLCALLSKSITVTLPVVFLLLSRWMGKSWDRKLVFRILPFLATALGVGLFTIYVEHHLVRAQGTPWDFSVVQRLGLAGRAFWFYLGKLFYPTSLAFIYPRWALDHSTLAAGSLCLALALLAAAAYGQKWWGKLPFAGLLFFALSLMPALGFSSFYFMRFSFVADHFQYLASIGIFMLAGWVISGALESLQVPLPTAFGLALVMLFDFNFALATNRQARKYSDPAELWEQTVSLNPDSAIAHHNLGIALSERGRLNEAVAHLRTAEALDPSFPQTHLALAYLALRANRREDAQHQYQEAIRLGVTDPAILKDYAALNKTLPPRR